MNLPNRQFTVKANFAHLALDSIRYRREGFANMAKDPKNRIKELRKAAGLTLEQLAERTGLSESYLSRMSRSVRNVSLKNIAKIADALGVESREIVGEPDLHEVPILTWVSAGELATDDALDDVPGTISVGGLDPDGDWIALKVVGDSMDRISPPESVIVVDCSDKELVPNGCYIIDDGSGKATYKRYRANPPRFEPVSTNPTHEPIFPDNHPTIVGRVKKTILDM